MFGPIVSAVNHRTPVTGADFTRVEVSQNAGGLQAIDPDDVAEVGNGLYAIPPAVLGFYHNVGPLIVHAEADGADPLDQRVEVTRGIYAPPLILGSTSYPLVWLMVDAADHITGKTGLTPTVTIRKAGGSFAAPVGSPFEVGRGLYALAPEAANYDTIGPLTLKATASGADDCIEIFDVAELPTDASATPDLFAALVAHLRSVPDLVEAFGDSATTPKFWPEVAPNTFNGAPIRNPILVYTEIAGVPGNYSSDGSYIEDGTFQISIFADGKQESRDLARSVSAALKDAPLTFSDGTLMFLRRSNWHSPPQPETGPDVPAEYQRVIDFRYMVRRTV